MRKLGEQWVEDGRMYKAVSSTDVCDGCHYLDTSVYPHERTCGECKTGTDELIVKYLGPVNKKGFLIDERTGLFPDVIHDKENGTYEAHLHVTLITPNMAGILVRVHASSMGRLRDTWNRRHS